MRILRVTDSKNDCREDKVVTQAGLQMRQFQPTRNVLSLKPGFEFGLN